jgi:hypothetical protein
MLFGIGIVETSEDFGAQGQPPSDPLLLDGLAREFVGSGWNVKAMMKRIVMSSAYRRRDHRRFRMPAEMIRDNALAIGGLLVEKIGGPSVRPYQPEGLWNSVAYDLEEKEYTAQVYHRDHGPDLYRRSLYTFWKRSMPPPSLTTFDAPNRESCVLRRARTNTPLQALVLLT